MMGLAVPSVRRKQPAAALRRSARGLKLTTALVAVAMAAGSAPLLVTTGARAAQQFWDGGSGVWNVGAQLRWDTGQPWLNGSDAVFGGLPGTVTIDSGLGTVDANSLTFTNFYNLAGDAFTLSGDPALIDVAAGATATIDAAFSNAGAGITKSGGGTLVLTQANTYTGGTTLNQGTITLISAGTLGSGAIAINGGTLRGGTTITVANAIVTAPGGASTFLAANGTTLTLSGIALHPSGDGMVAGHMTFGSSSDDGTIVFGDGDGGGVVMSETVIEVAGGTLRTAGADFGIVSSLNGNPALDVTVQVDSGATLDLNNTDTTINILKGDAGAIVTAGTGDLTLIRGDYAGIIDAASLTKTTTGTLTLSGASSAYTGDTTISAGTLVVGNAHALGTEMITFAGDATLRIAFDGTLANHITGSPGASPTIGFGAHSATLSGIFDYLGGAATTLHFGETGDTGTLTFAPGLYSLAPGSAWSLDGGTLRLGSTSASGLLGGLSAPNLAAGTTLDLNGKAFELKSATGSGTILNNGAGPVTLALSGTSAFAGSIRNGTQPVSVTKIGTGTTTLSGVNTYTGITNILDGTLALSGAGSIADSSGISLGTGATFDISQTTAGASVKSLSGDTGSSVKLGSKTLTVTNGGGTFFNGVLSDGGAGGGLTLAGGSLTLLNVNTYIGTTSIGDGGTLTNAGIIAGAVTNAGTFNNSGGSISGLLTNSAGTTTNSGVVVGGALVTGGTLNTTGTILGGLTSSATVNASGSISGTILNQSGGSFNVTGALGGGFDFSNDSGASLSVSGGDLTIAAGLTNNGTVSVSTGRSMTVGGLYGTSSAATLDTTGSATFAFGTPNTNNTYAGSFTGNGTIAKNGTGTEILTGNNGTGEQFTGTFDIDVGRLQVDGILGDTAGNVATVNVNPGATLGGNGTIAGDVFSHAGTISAGASPGVLAIAGDLDLDAATGQPVRDGLAGRGRGRHAHGQQ